jgi:hypothetical protein
MRLCFVRIRLVSMLVPVILPTCRAAAATPELALEAFASGLDRPVAIAHAGDGSGRVFVVEQEGRIRIHDGTQLLPDPFLDISGEVSCCGERGLLGLAFHPDYPDNGWFFVYYTDLAGDTVVERFGVSGGDSDLADASSGVTVLTVIQPASNHNGGHLAFGIDGMLYVALGDGGGAGDPFGNGQDPGSWLGSILRIEVDGDDFPEDDERTYGVPADNPFVGVPGAAEEIWVWGLRNPWRFSFDRLNGDLFIGDVGQGSSEEIDYQPASSSGGENWGWPCYEGSLSYDLRACGPASDYAFPILEYSHGEGCSVTAGIRYWGSAICSLRGTYLYGDYCSGTIWGAQRSGIGWTQQIVLSTALNISTFGEDEDGELYVAHHAGTVGAVYRIVDSAALDVVFCDGFESGGVAAWVESTGASP